MLRSGAIVLAGGRSRRMGTSKVWLDAGGIPLLRRVVEVLQTHCEPIVIAAAAGQGLPALPPGTVRVDDPLDLEAQGPLVGIERGLEALGQRGVERTFLGSCDAPLLSSTHLAFMLQRLAAQPQAEGVVPLEPDSARRHPLSSVVRVEPALGCVRELLASGERRATALFDRLRTIAIPIDDLADPAALQTCNTPEEWETIRHRLDSR